MIKKQIFKDTSIRKKKRGQENNAIFLLFVSLLNS